MNIHKEKDYFFYSIFFNPCNQDSRYWLSFFNEKKINCYKKRLI